MSAALLIAGWWAVLIFLWGFTVLGGRHASSVDRTGISDVASPEDR